ncbi:hypothetical protein Tco_0189467 [Tanacetum coccineum]
MLRKCHGHGLTKGAIIQIFYHGLDEPTQGILDITAGGIFLYKSPNQAFQLLEDKVLFNHDWPIKSKNEHHQKSIAFANESDSNTDNSRFMKKLKGMDSQIISLNEELPDIRKKYNKLREGNTSKNHLNDDTPMCERHEQNEWNFQTKIKNMERKIDEWSKSQNVSSKQTDGTDPPPPQAHTEHVNVVFTGSGKSDYSLKNLKDPPPSIIVNNKIKKDRPIKTSKRAITWCLAWTDSDAMWSPIVGNHRHSIGYSFGDIPTVIPLNFSGIAPETSTCSYSPDNRCPSPRAHFPATSYFTFIMHRFSETTEILLMDTNAGTLMLLHDATFGGARSVLILRIYDIEISPRLLPSEESTTTLPGSLAPTRADHLPPRKRFRDSYSSEASIEEDAEVGDHVGIDHRDARVDTEETLDQWLGLGNEYNEMATMVVSTGNGVYENPNLMEEARRLVAPEWLASDKGGVEDVSLCFTLTTVRENTIEVMHFIPCFDSALTWWNSHKRTIGDLMLGHTLCHGEADAKLMHRSTHQDAVRIANNLMDQKLKGYAVRNAENKRRLDNNYGNNRGQQPPHKRQNTGGQNVAKSPMRPEVYLEQSSASTIPGTGLTVKKDKDKSEESNLNRARLIQDYTKRSTLRSWLPPTQSVVMRISTRRRLELAMVCWFTYDATHRKDSPRFHTTYDEADLDKSCKVHSAGCKRKEKLRFPNVETKVCECTDFGLAPGEVKLCSYSGCSHKGLGADVIAERESVAYASRQLKIHEKQLLTHDLRMDLWCSLLRICGEHYLLRHRSAVVYTDLRVSSNSRTVKKLNRAQRYSVPILANLFKKLLGTQLDKSMASIIPKHDGVKVRGLSKRWKNHAPEACAVTCSVGLSGRPSAYWTRKLSLREQQRRLAQISTVLQASRDRTKVPMLH